MDKQRETNEKPAPARNPAKQDPPRDMTGRILDSASGLLRDSFSPNGAHQANTLARTLASETKAGPSHASASTERATSSELQYGQNLRQGQESLPSNGDVFREQRSVNGGIVSRSGDAAEGMSLDQFMHSAQHQKEVPSRQYGPIGKGKQAAQTMDSNYGDLQTSDANMSAAWNILVGQELPQALSATSSREMRGTTGEHRAAEVREDDGADVVKLLQDLDSSSFAQTTEGLGIDAPYTISPEDMRVAEEIFHSVDKAMRSKPGYKAAVSAASLGEPFPEFSSFFDDIEDYHSEVWGYLRPVVEEARAESAVSKSSAEGSGPATRRLRMILAHIDDLG